jgi:hypothetical protein
MLIFLPMHGQNKLDCLSNYHFQPSLIFAIEAFSGLTRNHQTRLKRLGNDSDSSLFCFSTHCQRFFYDNDCSFPETNEIFENGETPIRFPPGPNVIKRFASVIYKCS